MTPEQLEAHRVRFEQADNYPALPKKKRSFICTKCGSGTCIEGQEYQEHPACKCGYLGFAGDILYSDEDMHAYVDADRAQRSVPGAQGSDDKALMLADRLNSLCVAEFAWPYLNDAATELRRLHTMLAAQPPQQSAQPVAEFIAEQRSKPEMSDAMDQMRVRIAINCAFSWLRDNGEIVFAGGGMAAVDSMNAVINRLRDALSVAQPVKVQRGPTTDQIENAAYWLSGAFDYPWDHMPEQGRENMRKHVRMVMDALGIKPTSSEGGA